MTNTFWKPQPREPWHDWRTYFIFVPIIISALGFFVTGIFAFAFSDINVIAASTQSWLVIVGSGLIVWGAEMNTPGTTVEVFRKVLRHEHNTWDISALVVSLVGTVINLLVTFASRLTLDPSWRLFVLNWGPLLAGFSVACDYYGALVETGFLFGSYELRYTQWREEKSVWESANVTSKNDNNTELAQLSDRVRELSLELESLSWPRATIADYRRVKSAMNGQSANLDMQMLKREMQKEHKRLPSVRTVERWLSE